MLSKGPIYVKRYNCICERAFSLFVLKTAILFSALNAAKIQLNHKKKKMQRKSKINSCFTSCSFLCRNINTYNVYTFNYFIDFLSKTTNYTPVVSSYFQM